MKTYYVTRMIQIPVAVMIDNEYEMEKVRQMSLADFIEYWFANSDTDEREELLYSADDRQTAPQIVNEVDEQEDDV